MEYTEGSNNKGNKDSCSRKDAKVAKKFKYL